MASALLIVTRTFAYCHIVAYVMLFALLKYALITETVNFFCWALMWDFFFLSNSFGFEMDARIPEICVIIEDPRIKITNLV